MAKELDFIQIYYKDEQLTKLYDFSTPYKNETLSIYFENSVIKDLVPKCTAEFISVCSWRLAQKRGDMFRLADKTLTKEKILSADFDIAILTPRSPMHQIMSMASNWHGKSWDNAIAELRKFMFVPDEIIGNAIYENHFIARADIYKQYVSDCLCPVMDYMDGKEVFQAESGYITKKRDQSEIKETLAKLGMNDWPIAPFVLERLFRIWIEGRNFKIINL